jgi:hypothetical protein
LSRKSKLKELNKKFKVPSARKPPPEPVAVQAILAKVAADPAQRNGVGAIGTFLSNDGMPLPRYVVSFHQLFLLNISNSGT